jgi:2-(1,2-epoxy-1,2-dihydrophenyl)acetyl-CoA isomerase
VGDVLQVETVDRLRVLRLDRPERKNALDGALIGAFTGALRDAATDDDVWAVALTGNGGAFCSGLDLTAPDTGPAASGDVDPEDEAVRETDHIPMLMRVTCEKPIVAGIGGVAVGAGVSIAMAADVRIASPSARFHPGYARAATSPDFGLTWTLLRAVGYERAIRFLLEQQMVGAADLLAGGFVSEVVDSDEDLEPRLLEYGAMLASVAPMAARHTKRLLVAVDQPADLAAHLDEEIALALQGLSSEDGAEAIRALFSGDRPRFTGR